MPPSFYSRLPCPLCAGTGWRGNVKDYEKFLRRLEEARPRMSPAGFQEAWLRARRFQLRAFLLASVRRLESSKGQGALRVDASPTADLKQAMRVLAACFSFRARGPEVEALARYRKTQFARHLRVNRIAVRLGPEPIPGTSLTLRAWASGKPLRRAHEEQASAGKAPAEEPPPPPPPQGNIPFVGP